MLSVKKNADFVLVRAFVETWVLECHGECPQSIMRKTVDQRRGKGRVDTSTYTRCHWNVGAKADSGSVFHKRKQLFRLLSRRFQGQLLRGSIILFPIGTNND